MNYIGSLLVFAGAIVGICGSTWDSKKKGIKKVTTKGWVTVFLAFLGLALASYQTYQSSLSAQEATKKAEKLFDNVTASKETIDSLNRELVTYQSKLSAYEKVLGDIKNYSERQTQLVMIQAVTITQNGTWKAPNKVYGGSLIKIFFFKQATLRLKYGSETHIIRPAGDEWYSAFVRGNSGEEMEWSLTSMDGKFEGKVALYSTPRSRSSDWSWLEEQTDSL